VVRIGPERQAQRERGGAPLRSKEAPAPH